ncbi:hypothetical protein QBC39DRAFT_341960 [Podospora conica]|nr:hypothetical protein QBC39DRAFT_341960 [Schizothecium conicum]
MSVRTRHTDQHDLTAHISHTRIPPCPHRRRQGPPHRFQCSMRPLLLRYLQFHDISPPPSDCWLPTPARARSMEEKRQNRHTPERTAEESPQHRRQSTDGPIRQTAQAGRQSIRKCLQPARPDGFRTPVRMRLAVGANDAVRKGFPSLARGGGYGDRRPRRCRGVEIGRGGTGGQEGGRVSEAIERTTTTEDPGGAGVAVAGALVFFCRLFLAVAWVVVMGCIMREIDH